MLRRLPSNRIAAVLAAAAVAVVLGLYIASAAALHDGPSVSGSALLEAANQLACLVAVAAAAGQLALGAAGRVRLLRSTALLAGLAAVTALPVVALLLLSTLLLALGADARVDLESVVLAMHGTATDLTVVPVAFAGTAALVPLTARLRRRNRVLQDAPA